MRIVILLSSTLLLGCAPIAGRLGASVARTIPEEFHWVMFAITSVALAIWNYSEWFQQRGFKSSHWILTPGLALSVLCCFL